MASNTARDISVQFKARIFMIPVGRKKRFWANVRGFFKGEPWGYIELDMSGD